MKKFIIVLSMLAAFPPMSTDMYLPSLPLLQQLWNQSEAAVNLTLIIWFVTYCFFLLVYGPISDRVGRKPPLILGICLFIVSSLACALSTGLTMLIIARVFQAAGAASSTVMAMAIAKDLFELRQRAVVLSYIGVITALAPMLAPTLGGWIMMWLDWRWVFIAQAGLAAAVLWPVIRLREPLREPSNAKAGQAFKAYLRLTKNWRFSLLNLSMALPNMALFAFIAGSPSIYISRFGLSEAQFGYIFGFNALAMMTGSYGYSFLQRWFSNLRIMQASFTSMVVGGLMVAFLPHHGPWSLALPMWLVSLGLGLNRPPSNNILLEQVDQDAGSASSMIAFGIMLCGAVAMAVVSLAWPDRAVVIGLFACCGGAISLGTLTAMRKVLRGLGNDAVETPITERAA